jgi:hypothetical protein
VPTMKRFRRTHPDPEPEFDAAVAGGLAAEPESDAAVAGGLAAEPESDAAQ